MKITVIPTIRDFSYGAPGHCMGALVEELLKAGHEVQWLVAPIDLSHPEVVRLQERGTKVERLPEQRPGYVVWPRLRWKVRELAGAKTLRKIVNRFRPDHIFVNQGGTWCSLAGEIGELLPSWEGRYSLICHSNRPQPFMAPAARERARALAFEARRIFYNSHWCLRLAEKQIAQRIPAARVFQLPIRSRFREPLPWPKQTVPRFAMVSRLDAYTKGMDVVLESAARLRKEGLEFRISFYGAGADESYLRELAGFLEVKDVVSFRGHVDAVESIWKEEEMLLFPSRFEGFGASMLEAMGFGRPVLRTPYGGAEEWMEDGINGYLCPAPEVALLCATMRRALAERDRWEEMGRRAHEKVKACLDPNPARVFLEALD